RRLGHLGGGAAAADDARPASRCRRGPVAALPRLLDRQRRLLLLQLRPGTWLRGYARGFGAAPARSRRPGRLSAAVQLVVLQELERPEGQARRREESRAARG